MPRIEEEAERERQEGICTCGRGPRDNPSTSTCFIGSSEYASSSRLGGACLERVCLAIAFVANLTPAQWTIDSGASKHMCTHKHWFSSLKPYQTEIFVANNAKVLSKGIGTVRIMTSSGFKVIREVLYVPDLSTNLISVSALTGMGLQVNFLDKICNITGANGNQLLTGKLVNGLYKLSCDPSYYANFPVHSHFCNLTLHDVKTDLNQVDLWHRRLGHLNFDYMKKLLSCSDINVAIGSNPVCTTCVEAKQPLDSFPKGKSNRASQVLEIVHTDVMGPIRVSTFSGGRFILCFIDDFSRMTFTYILKEKSEVFKKFVDFKTLVENQVEKKIKILRSDNGTEYFNHNFLQFCSQSGIIQQSSNRYTPQQNGVAERNNRTIMDRVRAMLIDSKLDARYWGEAVLCSTYLKNISPTSAIAASTPYEIWFKRKPNLSHLRIFGSVGYVRTPNQLLSKLDPRSKPYIFVGYSDRQKGYRMADAGSPGKLVISKDVTFIEGVRNSDVKVDKNVYDFNSDQTMSLEPEIIMPDPPALEDGANNNDALIQDDGEEDVHSSSEDSHSESEEEEPNEPERRYPLRDRKTKREADMIYAFCCFTDTLDDPVSPSEALSRPDAKEWQDAMKSEYNSLIKNQTWVLVDKPAGAHVVGSKWVFKLKKGADGSVRHKARLVAKGFSQKYGIDYKETFSPTIPHETIRLLFALSANHDWHFFHLDVQTAFLNGDLAEDVYLQQPDGFIVQGEERKVCKLRKAIYGLKQASRAWNEKAISILQDLGFKICPYEPCLFTKVVNGKILILALYVDDFLLFAECPNQAKSVIQGLQQRIQIRNLGVISEYLGIRVRKIGRSIYLDQSAYAKEVIRRFNFEDCNAVSIPIDPSVRLSKPPKSNTNPKVPFRELIGSLMYLAICTRPDLMFVVSYLSQFNSSYTNKHWGVARNVLKYLAGTVNNCLVYSKSKEDFKIYCDSSWGNSFDRRSFSGMASVFANGAIYWRSKKQGSVALSTTEAEYVALCLGARHAKCFSKLLSYLVNRKAIIPVFCDNRGAMLIASDESSGNRLKHVDLKYHFTKRMVKKKICKILPVGTKEMPADIFTKALPKPAFNYCKARLGII